jgi:tetratricopeptide (TPR) repeat protein
VWQRSYDELGDLGFIPISVAMDSRGAEAAGQYIEQAKVTYPVLIDRDHLVAELYGMVNVPSAVWINEEGRIVRPTETAGTGDAFRGMADGGLQPDAIEKLRRWRRTYTAALKDWAQKGDESEFALSPDQVRAKLKPVTDDSALAGANFRLGKHLWEQGRTDEAMGFLEEAKRLRPDSWNFKRQTWNLQAPGDERSGGPEFWAAVKALGDHWYYEPVDMPGMD